MHLKFLITKIIFQTFLGNRHLCNKTHELCYIESKSIVAQIKLLLIIYLMAFNFFLPTHGKENITFNLSFRILSFHGILHFVAHWI